MRFMDADTLAFHQQTGLMAAAYSSQANGFFAGAYGRGKLPPAPGVHSGVINAYYSEANFHRLERAEQLAARYGCTANAIALAYLLDQSFPACAIIGCGTLDHLRESCAYADLRLQPEEIQWLNENELTSAGKRPLPAHD